MITNGHERAWLELMLNDAEYLKKMGFNTNLSDSDKKQIIDGLMKGLSVNECVTESNNTNKSYHTTSINVSASNLEENKTYKIVMPKNEFIAKFIGISTYNHFADDYLFEWVSGYDRLCNKHHGKAGNPNHIVLPKIVLLATSFYEVY